MSRSRRAALAAPALALALAAPLPARATRPIFPEPAPPEEFGRVILNAGSAAAGVPPVAFEHWKHRALFSCRLCHVDVGFAMQGGASQISRATNAAGLHCGACHDGKARGGGKPVFAACSAAGPFDRQACGRCHDAQVASRRRAEYAEFSKGLPSYGGGYVDWDAAEARRLVVPQDFVEGVSFPRDRLAIDRDVPIEPHGTWLGKVTFSHRRHATWNGCEVCHPEIFPNTRRDAVKFTMADLQAGRYCGVCHRSVAFPLAQCRRCHESGPGSGPAPLRFGP